MAYTPPNDLFTSEEAILSLASSIADEDRTNLGNGTVNGALDVLADALAEQDVEVPPMNAGAILALAQYVKGGGGGGSQTTDVYLWNEDVGLGAHGVTVVKYKSGTDSYDEVQFEGIATEFEGATICGVKAKDVPAGAHMLLITVNGDLEPSVGYSVATFPPQGASGPSAPMPIDGLYAVGSYNTDA